MLFELFSCTLRDVLDERGAAIAKHQARLTFDAVETCDVLIQVLRGLKKLHAQEPPVLHRDIKAENVFVQRSSLPPLPKLLADNDGKLASSVPRQIERAAIADFGEASRVTLDGRMRANVGTPEYMAPECFSPRHSDSVRYGTAADMYAFGMLVYEMLTLDIPFRSPGDDTIKQFDLPAHVIAGNRPKLSLKATPGPLMVLRSVYAQCTDADPSQRPSASALFRDLLSLVSHLEHERSE